MLGSATFSTLLPGWIFAFKHEAAAAAFLALWNNGLTEVLRVLRSLQGLGGHLHDRRSWGRHHFL